MKTFLILVVLFLSSSVVAEDISDFEIEGMSVGDNIQDHFSKNQLEKFYISYGKKHTGVEVYSNEGINHPRYFKLQTYDGMQVHYDDKSKKIIGIFGAIDFPDDISGCLKKLNEIKPKIESVTRSTIVRKKENINIKHWRDKSGKSYTTGVYYYFKNDHQIRLACYDWSEVMEPRIDHLRIGIYLKKYIDLVDSEYN
tara:strand:- start:17 stop:607 length:591 start_codon:yes stop_codon:yes gene_type:complete